MTALNRFLLVDKLIEPWERGMLLMEVLHEVGETKESYTNFLGAGDEESLFSSFNIKRFYKYSEEKNELINGYYWVKVDQEDAWEIAYYYSPPEDVFSVNGDEYLKGDIFLVDLEPITREEEDSEEG